MITSWNKSISAHPNYQVLHGLALELLFPYSSKYLLLQHVSTAGCLTADSLELSCIKLYSFLQPICIWLLNLSVQNLHQGFMTVSATFVSTACITWLYVWGPPQTTAVLRQLPDIHHSLLSPWRGPIRYLQPDFCPLRSHVMTILVLLHHPVINLIKGLCNRGISSTFE